MPAPTCWGTPGRESPLFIAGTWCSAWGRRHPQEPGQLPTGDWQPFREEEEEKAPDCQAAVQLLETAPVVVCITKHSSAGSGDTCLHPVAHSWKPRSQRSAGWRDPGVCLLRCRARHARAARGLEAQGWLVRLRQRWEGVKSALPAGSVPARFLCRCGAVPSAAAGLAARLLAGPVALPCEVTLEALPKDTRPRSRMAAPDTGSRGSRGRWMSSVAQGGGLGSWSFSHDWGAAARRWDHSKRVKVAHQAGALIPASPAWGFRPSGTWHCQGRGGCPHAGGDPRLWCS